MREFKNLDRQFGLFAAVSVGGFQCQRQRGYAIPQFHVLGSEGIGADLFEQPEVEQAVALLAKLGHLPLNLLRVIAGLDPLGA